MKKLLVGMMVVICLTMIGIAYAEEAPATPVAKVVEPITMSSLGLPDMQAGMIFSAKTGEFGACATLTALKYPTKIADIELRGGFAVSDIKEINAKKPIAALCVKVGDLSSLGIEQPLHNLINLSLGLYGGYDFNSKEADYGVMATIIQITF